MLWGIILTNHLPLWSPISSYSVGCRVEGERERRVAKEIDGALHIVSQIPHSVRCFGAQIVGNSMNNLVDSST